MFAHTNKMYYTVIVKQKKENPYCQCLFYSANALARNLTRLAEDAFAQTGLAPSHAFLLMAVNKTPGIQPNELSKILMLTPSTITRLIEKLERKNLVERKTSGRETKVYSTPKGKAMDENLRTSWSTLYKNYTLILGSKESKKIADSVYQAAIELDQP